MVPAEDGRSVMETHVTTRPEPSRAIYTAMVGGYETVVPRIVPPDAGIECLFFTDSPDVAAPDGWHRIVVTSRFASDPVRSARHLKITGHPALREFDETLWVDNRVQVKPNVRDLFDLLRGHDIAVPYHSFRTSVAAEFSEVIASGYDDPDRVRAMFQIARDAGVLGERPFWTGLLLRRRSADVDAAMRAWWELLLLTSRRDQLSFNVATGTHEVDVRPLDLDNRASEFHEWLPHTALRRDRSVQMWRRTTPPVLAASDLLRSTPYGRKAARALTRMGLTVPTVPRLEGLS
jgi:hypothetical protein